MSNSKSNHSFPAGDRVSIFQRGKAWYANYQQDGRQVRRSLQTRNKREAILRAQRIERELVRGDQPAETVNATIAAAIDAYLQHHTTEDRAPKTLVKYRQVSGRIRALAEERRVTHVRQLDFRFADAFKAALKQKGQSPKTIYTAVVILRSLVKFAYRRKLSDLDPLAGYRISKPKPAPQPAGPGRSLPRLWPPRPRPTGRCSNSCGRRAAASAKPGI